MLVPDGTASAQPRGLSVRITEPSSGIVEGPTVDLEAEVSDPTVRTASLVVNGATYEVPVEQGRITQTIVAVPGNNRIGVVVARGAAVARDSLTFRYTGEPIELVVLLGWPSRGEIIDLWVREPNGETCKWDHRQTGAGGRLLDFSQDAIGFGSQAYVLPTVTAGRFRIKVHYWGDFAHDDDRGPWVYDEMITELDRLEGELARRLEPAERRRLTAERNRLRERLDRWSTPGAPQTAVRAEVVLFPGTRSERRWRFDVLVHRTGQLATLGEVEIDEQMIRAARSEEP
jgi:hypothetical protein